jgi:hypothetical protein
MSTGHEAHVPPGHRIVRHWDVPSTVRELIRRIDEDLTNCGPTMLHVFDRSESAALRDLLAREVGEDRPFGARDVCACCNEPHAMFYVPDDAWKRIDTELQNCGSICWTCFMMVYMKSLVERKGSVS